MEDATAQSVMRSSHRQTGYGGETEGWSTGEMSWVRDKERWERGWGGGMVREERWKNKDGGERDRSKTENWRQKDGAEVSTNGVRER